MIPRRTLLTVGLAALAGCGTTTPATHPRPSAPTTSYSLSPAADEPAFDTTAHSTTDPASIWVIVNKTHPLEPADFVPELTLVRGYQVARPAAGPLTRLLDAADASGLRLKIASAYRSYGYQAGVHGHLVATEGDAAADAVSARPGYSEHQTGLAVDLENLDGSCALDACFARLPAGRWLTAHAWEYGFIERYTQADRAVTGYSPEPWHFRYVGTPLAARLHHTGVATLEQLFGVTGGDYPVGD